MPFIAEDVIVIRFIQVSYKQQAFLTGIATVVGKSKPIAKQIQQLNFEFSSVDIRASEKMGTALPFLQLMFIFLCFQQHDNFVFRNTTGCDGFNFSHCHGLYCTCQHKACSVTRNAVGSSQVTTLDFAFTDVSGLHLVMVYFDQTCVSLHGLHIEQCTHHTMHFHMHSMYTLISHHTHK